MRSAELDRTCQKLNVEYSKYEKNLKKAVISVIVLFTILVAILVFTPEGKTVNDSPETSYPGGIGILVSTIFLFYFANKVSKTKKTGYEKYLVKLYRAYTNLQQYQKDEDSDKLDSATLNLNSIVTDLSLDWGDLTETNTSFKSLKIPVSNFINNLDWRLIPALGDEKIEILKIISVLEKVIEFFDNDDFNQISKVNDEIVNNFDEQTEEGKKLLEQIRENRYLLKILISASIIAAAGGISFVAKLIVNATYVDFVGWWIILSSPFVVAYLWKSK